MMSLRQAGTTDAAIGLCSDIAEQYPEAAWAQQQLGSLALEQGRAEEAVTALQLGLRRDPGNAPSWEALGAAYHMLGRFTAALKVSAFWSIWHNWTLIICIESVTSSYLGSPM